MVSYEATVAPSTDLISFLNSDCTFGTVFVSKSSTLPSRLAIFSNSALLDAPSMAVVGEGVASYPACY